MTPIVDRLTALADKSTRMDSRKTDYVADAARLRFNDAFHLEFTAPPLPRDVSAFRRFNPFAAESLGAPVTDNGLAQMAAKLGTTHYGRGSTRALPMDFISRFPAEDRAEVMNRILRRSDGKWMLRTDGGVVRAVLDERYPRVWNTDLLEQVRRVFIEKPDMGEGELVRPVLTPDELFVKVMFPGAGTSHYRIGFLLANGEIGNRRVQFLPLIQDRRCENSIVISEVSAITGQDAGLSVVHHRGLSASALMTAFYVQLVPLLGASAKLVNKMIEAESATVPEFRAVLEGLAEENGWTAAEDRELLDIGTRGERTVAGLVSGVTYFAQHTERLTDAERVPVEILGGNLLGLNDIRIAELARKGQRVQRARLAA